MLQIAKNLDPQILNIILVIVGGYGIFMSLQPTKRNADRSILTVGGIYNEGNTCFMNSVLQSFASMESFTKYLISKSTESNPIIKESLSLSSSNHIL